MTFTTTAPPAAATVASGGATKPGAGWPSPRSAALDEAGTSVSAASTVGVLPRSPAVEALSVAARFGDRTAAAPPVPRFTCRGAGGVETGADGRHRAHRPSATASTGRSLDSIRGGDLPATARWGRLVCGGLHGYGTACPTSLLGGIR